MKMNILSQFLGRSRYIPILIVIENINRDTNDTVIP